MSQPTPHLRDAPLPMWVVQAQRRDMRDVVFTRDGRCVVTAGDDAPIHVWSAQTGEKLRSFAGHARGSEALAVHPDGDRIFSAGRDKCARAWDLHTGALRRAYEGHTGAVTAVAVSPDGAFLATGSTDRTMRIWDLHGGDCISTWKGHRDPVRVVAFTDVGGFPWAWSGCESGLMMGGPVGASEPRRRTGGERIIARDPHADRIIVRRSFRDAFEDAQAAVHLFGPDGVGPPESHLEGHLGEVRCATFTPEGVALTGSADRGLRRFSIDGRLASHLRVGGAGCDVLAVHPDGAQVAVGDADGRLLVFDGAVVFDAVHTPPHSHAISAVGLDERGRPWSLGRDGRLVVRGPDLAPIAVHALREVKSMHSSAGYIGGGWWRHGPVTVSSTRARGLERWEMVNRPSVERYRLIEDASAEHVAVGHDRIAMTLLDRTLRICDAESLDELARVELKGYGTAVALGPEDRVAVSDDAGNLFTCDRDGCRVEASAPGRITALGFSRDGGLYMGDSRGRLHDPDGRSAAGHGAAIGVIAFAADGAIFTAGADRQVLAWRDGAPVARWLMPVPVNALWGIEGGALYGDAAGAMGRLDLP